MRLVIARCTVDYTGRLNAHLALATRLLVHKGDGSLLVHSDGGSYKPLNWMSPPCSLVVEEPDAEAADALVELCGQQAVRGEEARGRVAHVRVLEQLRADQQLVVL